MQPMFVVKNRHTKSFLVEKSRNSNLDIQPKLINSFSRLNVSTVRKIEFNFIINIIKVKLTSRAINRTGRLKSTVKISSSNTLAVMTIQTAVFRIIKSMTNERSGKCGEKNIFFQNVADEFLFPPDIYRINLKEKHLFPFIRERFEEERRTSSPFVVQILS